MSKKSREQENYERQSDFIMDTLKLTGSILERALKEAFFRRRIVNNVKYKYLTLVNDNPIASFMIEQLDRERAVIDMEEYEAMIKATHEAVKKEAMAAAEEGINEVILKINSINK